MTKDEKIRNNLMRKIFNVCLQIQLNTKHAVFFDLWGHVSELNISIRESKEDYQRVLYDKSIYIDIKWWNDLPSINEYLQEILDELKQFYKEADKI